MDSYEADEFWDEFAPAEHAVLAFLHHEGQLLLIHKKRGLGAGKISAPGGRIEPGETPEAAALRETTEEVGIILHGPTETALLDFAFRDGFMLRVTVFVARDYSGEPVETAEALPFWSPVDDIPYDRMWDDDRLWLPLVLAGTYVRGRFVFDRDRMTWSSLQTD